MNHEKIRAQFTETLDAFNVPWKNAGVDANLNAWEQNKGYLVALLRNHPNWDDDELAIVYTTKHIRSISRVIVERSVCALEDLLYGSYLPEQGDIMDAIKHIAYGLSAIFVGNAPYIENLTGVKCNNQQYSNKIIGKILRAKGVDKLAGYEKAYADLSDSLKPITVEATAVLSVHPCAYLTMSHGNSWSSCHSIKERGCNHSGTLSYMNDRVTMVFYTVNNETDRDYHKKPKETRQVFFWSNGVLIQSRLYPDTHNEKDRAAYRHIVQSALAECLDEPNLWKLNREQLIVDGYYDTFPKATHYKDYRDSLYKSTVSRLKDVCGRLMIGNAPRCLCCGAVHNADNYLCCPDGCKTQQEELPHCASCENEIYDDSYLEEEGEIYCMECASQCEECGGGAHATSTVRNNNGTYMEVCNTCWELLYLECSQCYDLVRATTICTDNGRLYCQECFDINVADEEGAEYDI